MLYAQRTAARARPTQKRTGALLAIRLRSSAHGLVPWDAALRENGGSHWLVGRQQKHSIRKGSSSEKPDMARTGKVKRERLYLPS